MKTEGLTIQEAVKRLKEGRCECAMNERTKYCFTQKIEYFRACSLFDTYTLINPKPKMEEVREKRWMLMDGRIMGNYYTPDSIEKGQWVEVIYQKEVEDE